MDASARSGIDVAHTGAAAANNAVSLPATMRAGDNDDTCNNGNVPRSRSPARALDANDGNNSDSRTRNAMAMAASIGRPDASGVDQPARSASVGSTLPLHTAAMKNTMRPAAPTRNGASFARK